MEKVYTNYNLQNYKNFSRFQKPVKEKEKFNVPVLASTIAGTLIPLAAIKTRQNLNKPIKGLKKFNIFNITYDLPQILLVSAGSVLGGLAGGLVFDKKNDPKPKVKEGIFSYLNIAVPTALMAGMVKLTKNMKKGFKKNAVVAVSTIGAIVGGMQLGAFVSNKINSALFDKTNAGKKQRERKLQPKDYIVHIDDLAGVLALTKAPILEKVMLDKLLPVFYARCGYEVGTKKDEFNMSV